MTNAQFEKEKFISNSSRDRNIAMAEALGRNTDWVPIACLWALVALLVIVLGIGIYNTIEPDKDVHGVPCTISAECE